MPKYLLSFAERIGGVTMPRITEEEAWALDEEVTKNPPRVDPSKARHVSKMVALDDFSSEYLKSVSAVTQKTPSEIIGEMVREKN
jgi:hypothetical protein